MIFFLFVLYFSKEIQRACDKKQPFDFSYYIFICKLYKLDEKAKNKKKKKGKTGQEQEIVWSNPEEELIDQVFYVYVYIMLFKKYLYCSFIIGCHC